MKHWAWLLMMICLCMLPMGGLGEATPTDIALPMAEDITDACMLGGAGHMGYIRDHAYNTIWDSSYNNGKRSLTITAPEGKTLGGILIHWWRYPTPITLQEPDGQGGWRDVRSVAGQYVEQLSLIHI